MAPAFWEAVLREQEALRARGIQVGNGIQTNATLITAASLPLLRQLLGEGGAIGTSVDPMPGIRELKGGPDGAYAERWQAALDLLRDAGFRYGLLYVVHRLSLPELPELYRQLRRRHPGAGLRFNPLYRQGRAAADWEDLGIGAEEWGHALATLHRAWSEDGRPSNVQPFAPWQQVRDGGPWRLSCECSGQCGASHFGVDPSGAVHLCGRSADAGAFRYGLASGLTAEALERHPLRTVLGNRGPYLKRTGCRACPWWLYCHGGCVNDSLLEHASAFVPTSFCAGLKTFFAEAYPEEACP
jgi:uncharacterized protein